MTKFRLSAGLTITCLFSASICSVAYGVGATGSYAVPGDILPTSEPGTIVEGVHKFGSPFVTRPMAYSSTGRLINSIVLDAGWGAEVVNIPAETPVFGVVFRYTVRTGVTSQNFTKARWCGVLPVAHESLGDSRLFCATDGAGTNASVMSRVFDGPEAAGFARLGESGSPFYPIELSRLGGSPRIKGVFSVRTEPVDFQKKLWTGLTVSSWSNRFASISQVFGDGEKQNFAWVSNDTVAANGQALRIVGRELVILQQVDSQHYSAKLVTGGTSIENK